MKPSKIVTPMVPLIRSQSSW